MSDDPSRSPQHEDPAEDAGREADATQERTTGAAREGRSAKKPDDDFAEGQRQDDEDDTEGDFATGMRGDDDE